MTVEEAILSHDMEDIINRMILYAKEKNQVVRHQKTCKGKEPFRFLCKIFLCKSLESKTKIGMKPNVVLLNSYSVV